MRPSKTVLALAGPLLTVVVAVALFFLSRHGVQVYNPALLFVVVIVLAAYLGGHASGLASVGLTLVYVLLTWSTGFATFVYSESSVSRLVVFGLTMPMVSLLVSYLQSRNQRMLEWLHAKGERLRESEARLRRAELVAGIGNWEVDLRIGALVTSEGARRIYGIPDDCDVFEAVKAIPLPEYRPALDAALHELVTRGAEYVIEFKIRRPSDGVVADIQSRAKYDAERHRVYGTIKDITERKRAERELIEANRQANSASETKSLFLANMSHEIRTPLNGILGALQLLKADLTDPEHAGYVNMAIRSSQRLAHLLTDLLDLSRVEAGRMPVACDPFDLARLGEAVRELFQFEPGARGLSLDVDIAPGLPQTVLGDEGKTRQILFNLVGNALKFTERGGVRLSLSPLPFGPGKAGGAGTSGAATGGNGAGVPAVSGGPGESGKSGGQGVAGGKENAGGDVAVILFMVQDTGKGIPDVQLHSIFDPFTQGDNSYVRRHQGAGLGLSIVRRLVALLGGTICVDSEEGRGTTFCVTLPFRTAERCELPPEVADCPPPPQDGAPVRVLLAEDDATTRMVGQRLLQKAGYHVTLAVDGDDALARLAAEDVDVVLMDIHMPNTDGITAASTIRTSPRFVDKRNVPILAVTAAAMAGDRERFLAAGMDGYVAKPFDMADLVEEIECARKKRQVC
ncbi:response regulator [Nitratidesulfovibrio liaohensis]|uniref:response regulator n=1 Tax=Nitratidesulfovibrio liaohensis TaxID=2604158 RepID=UPI00142250A4|nr:response regulator [Nitratidesulfovibrio liaohensis]